MSWHERLGRLIPMHKALPALCLFAAILSAGDAIAISALVRSKDDRLQAFALPGAAWCSDAVSIRFEGKPEVFSTDRAFVQKFIGGVRAAVTAECPGAVSMRFHGRGANSAMFRAYSSKSSNWAIREIAAVGVVPAPAFDDAARREVARIDATLLNALAGAQRVNFVSDAEAGTAHAAWRISNVALGLTIQDQATDKPVAIKDRVEAIGREAERACPTMEARSFSATEPKVARETFICRQPPNSYAYGILAYVSGAQNYVLGLYSPNADTDNGSNLIAVSSAFERIIASDW